ncbi:MAG: tyrosine-type recombinase/integrase [Candidatus Freyarchaeota archaeon]
MKRNHHYVLVKVLEFLKEDLGVGSVEGVLKADAKEIILSLRKYIAKLVGEGLSAKSIRFHLYLIRSFLSFYDIEISPKKLKVPRKVGKSRIDRIPSLAEIQKLVMGTRSRRLRLAIMVMALCGLRLNECLSLRREWIDLERGFIIIPPEIAKTGKGREVPIPMELREELKRYLGNYPYERGYIFCVEGNPEKKIPKARFYESYIELLKRLGLDKRTPDGTAYQLHPHVLRKWYRTMLESAGVNKLLIDLWMGHNSGIEKVYYLPTPEIIKAESDKVDKALRIFGSKYAPMTSEKAEALEEAIKFYEKLMDHLARKNPRLLRELGIS